MSGTETRMIQVKMVASAGGMAGVTVLFSRRHLVFMFFYLFWFLFSTPQGTIQDSGLRITHSSMVMVSV